MNIGIDLQIFINIVVNVIEIDNLYVKDDKQLIKCKCKYSTSQELVKFDKGIGPQKNDKIIYKQIHLNKVLAYSKNKKDTGK